jgi:hypothetical protein
VSHVVLVGCGGSKRPAAAPARDLYTSNLFRKSAAYAAALGGPWYIASAKHGLLHPDTVIAPYDVRLGSGRGAPPIHAWATGLLDALWAAEPALERLTVLAGATYVEPLRWALRGTPVAVQDPLRGLGIGQRLAWLTERLAA